jgi:competence protein ComEC
VPRLLPILAASHAFGIWLADRTALTCVAALVCCAASLGAGITCRRPRWRAACAALAALFAGALALGAQLERAARHRPLRPVARCVEGTVARVARFPTWMRVDLARVAATDVGPPVPERVRVHGSRSPPGVAALEAALPGERLRACLRLRAPSALRNPGGRDGTRAIARAGIGALAGLAHPALHVRVPAREGLRPLIAVHRARRRAAARLSAAGEGGALLRALGLGDREGLDEEARAAFASLGVAHLLAVSGLHLALVAALAYALAGRLLRRSAALAARFDTRLLALFAAFAAAFVYAVASGFGVPARRALVLLAAVAIALARDRPTRRLAPLSAAALLVLALEPQALFEAGAQMSFAASAALLFMLRAPRARDAEAAAERAGLVRASATALAATSPLAALHLGVVAPAALLANLVLIPWFSACLLPAALLGAALAAAAPEAAITPPILWLAEKAARITLTAVTLCAAQVPSAEASPDPAPLWIVVAFVLGAAVLVARRTRSRVVLALVVQAVLIAAPPASVAPARPRALFLDVGQGDATLVQGGSGAVLVDAGSALPGRFDRGRDVVVPALAALDIRRIDLLVATHADLDHRGGIPAVLERVPVSRIWLPPGGLDDPAFGAVVETARVQGVRVLERGAGEPAARVGELVVTPLWPPRDARFGPRNDRSLVIRIEVAGRRVLIPGDLEMRGEAALIASGVDLAAEVLKLPHHGSRSSSSPAFLAAVAPQLAVASAPCAGRFSMPHAQVLARVRARATSLFWTGRDGAVIVGLGDAVVARGSAPRRAHCAHD